MWKEKRNCILVFTMQTSTLHNLYSSLKGCYSYPNCVLISALPNDFCKFYSEGKKTPLLLHECKRRPLFLYNEFGPTHGWFSLGASSKGSCWALVTLGTTTGFLYLTDLMSSFYRLRGRRESHVMLWWKSWNRCDASKQGVKAGKGGLRFTAEITLATTKPSAEKKLLQKNSLRNSVCFKVIFSVRLKDLPKAPTISLFVPLQNEWIQSPGLPSQWSWLFASTYPLMKTFCFLLICSKLLFPLFYIGSGLQQGCCELSIITLERGQFCLPMLADCRTAKTEWERSETSNL